MYPRDYERDSDGDIPYNLTKEQNDWLLRNSGSHPEQKAERRRLEEEERNYNFRNEPYLNRDY